MSADKCTLIKTWLKKHPGYKTPWLKNTLVIKHPGYFFVNLILILFGATIMFLFKFPG
jgi:hypothetical protein